MFALVAAEEAMKDSALNLETLDLDRAGVIFGSGIGGFTTIFEEMEGYFKILKCHALILSSSPN